MNKNKLADRRVAIAGEAFTLFVDAFGNKSVVEIRPKPKNAIGGGYWLCCGCGVALQHNMAKDKHCRERPRKPLECMTVVKGEAAQHVLCWFDYASGEYQVP